jgi:homocitrate synthase NifV
MITLIDSTLRDGEQAPGVVLSYAAKRRLAERLAEAGLDEIEIGIPALASDELGLVGTLEEALPDTRVLAWCRAHEDDIARATACKATAIHLSFPISDLLLGALGWTRGEMLDRARQMLASLRSRFEWVSVGAQDASRATGRQVEQFAALVATARADRLRLADTVGIWTPARTQAIFARLAAAQSGLPLGIHAHNDLGLATANSLAAIEGGATHVDVTVNGLGERAGNTALEQLAVLLHLDSRFSSGVKLDQLCALSAEVADASSRTVPPHQPVVGKAVFTHESGIHVSALLRDRRAYEPFDKRLIGHRGELSVAIGTHSGTAALRHVLTTLGIDATCLDISQLLSKAKQQAASLQRSLSADELRTLCGA